VRRVTGFLAEKGSPAPWVEVGPNPGGQFFTVSCRRCGVHRVVYTVTLREKPTLLAELAAEHDHCTRRPGSLDPWVPGTP
jgi:hypothetical protein